MNFRLSFTKYSFLITYFLGFSLPLLPMEPINLETSEGQEVTLQEPLVPTNSLELIKKNKDKIDKQLSQKSWRIAFDIFAINKFVEFDPTIELDMTEKEKNPFFKHNAEHNDAKQLIVLLLHFTPQESPVTNKVLQAFILFTQGNITNPKKLLKIIPLTDHEFLNKLDANVKTTLDKYRYLHFNKHFDLPNDLLGYVSLEELIKFNKLDDSKIKKQNYIGSNDETMDNAFESKTEKQEISFDQEIHLNNCYLADLTGWQALSKQNYINPQWVCLIDLSHNNLKEIPADLLQGFVSLKNFSIAHNKLKSLPSHLFDNCSNIMVIDLSHNQLIEIPDEITTSGQLSYAKLNLDYNPLAEAAKKALTKLRPGHLVKTNNIIDKSNDDFERETFIYCCFIGTLAILYNIGSHIN